MINAFQLQDICRRMKKNDWKLTSGSKGHTFSCKHTEGVLWMKSMAFWLYYHISIILFVLLNYSFLFKSKYSCKSTDKEQGGPKKQVAVVAGLRTCFFSVRIAFRGFSRLYRSSRF